jgi:hypothetical protein
MKKETEHLLSTETNKERLLEDVFNDEKRQGVKDLIDAHKQTLEEASWNHNPLKKLDGEFLRHAFKEGAKSDAAKDYWFEKFKQEERSYSEKDLEKAFKIGFTIGYSNDVRIDERDKSFNRWFEQFKNK